MSLGKLAVVRKKYKPSPCPIQIQKVVIVMLMFSEVS